MTAQDKTPDKTSMTPVPERSGVRHPLMTLRDDIDRMVEDMFRNPFARFDIEPFRWMGGQASPRMDVKETDQALVVIAELPGIPEDKIDVSLSGDLLTIKGEKTVERNETEADWHLTERSHGRFSRTLRLPEAIDSDRVEAKYEHGVLTVTIPKTDSAPAKTKKIEIKH